MLIYPAIDLLDGACVRLRRGSFQHVREYDPDPIRVARSYANEGATALHLVDLDGARLGRPVNGHIVRAIGEATDVKLQVGGGIRSAAGAARYLDAGIDSVIVGTAAVREPEWVLRTADRYGAERVALALDVRHDRVVVAGWMEETELTIGEALDRFERLGITNVVYTDVWKDGTLASPDLEGARTVVERGFRTIVAGGVTTVADVERLRELGAAGAVIGSALYEGHIRLEDAIRAAESRGAGESRC